MCALMKVSSHYWLPFHANDCVFSRNEQQKVNCSDNDDHNDYNNHEEHNDCNVHYEQDDQNNRDWPK